MTRNITVTTALSVAFVSFAGAATASTCNLIAQDKEINFTLTQGNPVEVVEQACDGAPTDLVFSTSDFVLTDTRGWRSIQNAPTGNGAPGARAAGFAAGGFPGGGGGGGAGGPNVAVVAAVENVEQPSPVPLPAAGGMLIVALGGLAAMRKRRKV